MLDISSQVSFPQGGWPPRPTDLPPWVQAHTLLWKKSQLHPVWAGTVSKTHPDFF